MGRIGEVFRDAPSHRQTLASDESPDGTKRYGFFSSELKGERTTFLKKVGLGFGLTTIAMFLLLSIYFGSYYDQIWRSPHFTVEILDLDSIASPYGSVAHPAILGPAVRSEVDAWISQWPRLGYLYADEAVTRQMQTTSGGQGLDPFSYATQRVENQDVWAVMIVNANATSGVWNAITSGAFWDPQGAVTFITSEARNFYGTEQYVLRLGTEFVTQATAQANSELVTQVLALGNASAVLAAAQPQAIVSAFAYNQWTLQPFDQLAGIAATTVGAIYLVIFTFFISLLWNQIGLPLIGDKLALPSEILIKVIVPFIGYFWLSLHYSLISLAFLVDFNRKYGKIGFVLYWMLNWVTMSALGFVMETLFLWLGPFFPFFLLFWVILNVSVAFIDIGNMNRFYSYGYIVPVWNQVDGAKSIIFGTKNHLPQNFLVNISWMLVWILVLMGTVVFQRRKKEKARMKEVWGKMKEKDLDTVAGPKKGEK